MKKVYTLSIFLLVFCFTGCQKINSEDVGANQEQEIIEEKVTEVGNADRIEETNSQTYNEVSTYEKLKDIKAVVVEKEINKSLEEQGVDWYEIWPDLEHYDIFNGYLRLGYPKVYWIP